MNAFSAGSLLAVLAELPDPPIGHQEVPVWHRLGFRRKPPTRNAFRNLLMALCPQQLEAALRWAKTNAEFGPAVPPRCLPHYETPPAACFGQQRVTNVAAALRRHAYRTSDLLKVVGILKH